MRQRRAAAPKDRLARGRRVMRETRQAALQQRTPEHIGGPTRMGSDIDDIAPAEFHRQAKAIADIEDLLGENRRVNGEKQCVDTASPGAIQQALPVFQPTLILTMC